MLYVTQSIASQSAIISANNAQSSIISANQNLMDLAKRGGDLEAIQAREKVLMAEKLKAETEAKVAQAQKKAIEEKKKKSKNKLDYFA